MIKKGKRAKITDRGRKYIGKRALDSPRLQRTELAMKLQDELETMGEDKPEVEVLERMISNYRNHHVSPQEKPWGMATLIDHDLPPEAIPIILVIQERRRLNNEKPLTIREAWWLSRLRCQIGPPKVLGIPKVLSLWANTYASQERIAEITKTQFDTSELDQIFTLYAEEYAAYPWNFELIKERCGIDVAGLGFRFMLDFDHYRYEPFSAEWTHEQFMERMKILRDGTFEKYLQGQELPEDQQAKIKQFTDALKELESKGKELALIKLQSTEGGSHERKHKGTR